MKKLVILFTLFLSITWVSSAQDSRIGFREETAERLAIGTNYQMVNMADNKQLGPSVSYYWNKKTGKKDFYLGFWMRMKYENRYTMDKNAKVLIKTKSGNVVTLTNKEDRVRRESDSNNYYSVMANLLISESNLKKLIDEGIEKVRFETTRGFVDYYSKNDALAATISRAYQLVLGKSDFGADF